MYMGPSPDTLQGVMFQITKHSDCKKWWNGPLPTSAVCAGYMPGGKDTCQGDSGGPMVVRKDEIWYIYGVTSFGYRCAEATAHGVYVRVTSFVTWIMDQTNGELVADVLDGPRICLDESDVYTDVTGNQTNPQAIKPKQNFTPQWKREAMGTGRYRPSLNPLKKQIFEMVDCRDIYRFWPRAQVSSGDHFSKKCQK